MKLWPLINRLFVVGLAQGERTVMEPANVEGTRSYAIKWPQRQSSRPNRTCESQNVTVAHHMPMIAPGPSSGTFGDKDRETSKGWACTGTAPQQGSNPVPQWQSINQAGSQVG